MESQSLINVMTGAVVVSAIALILQACFLGVMAMTARRLITRVPPIIARMLGSLALARHRRAVYVKGAVVRRVASGRRDWPALTTGEKLRGHLTSISTHQHVAEQ